MNGTNDTWLTIEVQISILGAWSDYANAHKNATDVLALTNTGLSALRLRDAFIGKPQSWVLSAITEGMKDKFIEADFIINAINPDANINYGILLSEQVKLDQLVVQRTFPDGTVANTPLTEWEKFSLIIQKHSGLDVSNVAKVVQEQYTLAGENAAALRQLYSAAGIDIDFIVGLTDSEIDQLGSDLNLPAEILEEFQFKAFCFSAGTQILVMGGEHASIETLRPGDIVLAFDHSVEAGRGALVPKRVVRLFHNETGDGFPFRGTRVAKIASLR
ncbi:hypothetical protein EQ718_14515 (plasmid) [Paracoccus versutus]|uniref:Uncharacterized protein n=1 Tax=Paracoccus versutus TaxID=34007 RepID=A0AAQ0HET6_PARVE|nr:hypothetical protein [Paracoccus versutus]REG34066.1 hypothetical protein ATH84_104030 [Paracoccus versutus]WEJ80125.1 hypothetical protein EQ718_14515 [Paracoccus versutus]